MSYVLAIGFSSQYNLEKGLASWSGEYLSQIGEFSPLSELSENNITRAIGYITGKANSALLCTELFIQSVTLNKKFFRVEYCAADTIKC